MYSILFNPIEDNKAKKKKRKQRAKRKKKAKKKKKAVEAALIAVQKPLKPPPKKKPYVKPAMAEQALFAAAPVKAKPKPKPKEKTMALTVRELASKKLAAYRAQKPKGKKKYKTFLKEARKELGLPKVTTKTKAKLGKRVKTYKHTMRRGKKYMSVQVKYNQPITMRGMFDAFVNVGLPAGGSFIATEFVQMQAGKMLATWAMKNPETIEGMSEGTAKFLGVGILSTAGLAATGVNVWLTRRFVRNPVVERAVMTGGILSVVLQIVKNYAPGFSERTGLEGTPTQISVTKTVSAQGFKRSGDVIRRIGGFKRSGDMIRRIGRYYGYAPAPRARIGQVRPAR